MPTITRVHAEPLTDAAATTAVREVLSQFFEPVRAGQLTVSAPATPGLSGAPVWLVHDAANEARFVLKQVLANQVSELVAWRHALLFHLHASAADLVGCPRLVRKTVPGADSWPTVLDTAGHGRWQLLHWRPGAAISQPTRSEVAAAVAAVARLHQAAARFAIPWPGQSGKGWAVRTAQLAALAADGWPVTRHPPTTDLQRTVAPVAEQAAAIFADCGGHDTALRWAAMQPPPLPVQPVLRDLWWGHVLFSAASPGQRHVTGVIDFDAAGVDTPATDLARLLGSLQLHGGNPDMVLAAAWPEAVAAYAATARPPQTFWDWVQRYHDTAVVCGLAQWCCWILAEARVFPHTVTVTGRITALLRGLPAALHRLGTV
jgi:Ser/Thr protein kinase RdoA (MazF antagonist)